MTADVSIGAPVTAQAGEDAWIIEPNGDSSYRYALLYAVVITGYYHGMGCHTALSRVLLVL